MPTATGMPTARAPGSRISLSAAAVTWWEAATRRVSEHTRGVRHCTHRHTVTQTHRHTDTQTHTTHHTHTRRCQARTAICSRRVARYSSPALSSSGAGTGSSAEGTMITATADACFDNFVHFVFKSLRTRTIICGSTSGYFQ